VQRNAHGNLKLGGGKVHLGDHFRDRMFHLEARVELKKVELLIRLQKAVEGQICNFGEQ